MSNTNSIFEAMETKGKTGITVLPTDPVIDEAMWLSVKMKKEGHQLIRVFNYPDGPKGAIAIHSLTLGPALGGIRAPIDYYSEEKDLFLDVMRLASTMTVKAALAGLNLGGGKCALWRDKDTRIDLEYLKMLSAEINALDGNYIAAEDMSWNSTTQMKMLQYTQYVVGLPSFYTYSRDGMSCTGSGDPGDKTALGLVSGWKICMKILGLGDPSKIPVAIQGLGSVGNPTAHIAYQNGFRQFFFSEKNVEDAKRYAEDFEITYSYDAKASAVESNKIYDAPAIIFASCAGSGVITEERARRLAKAGCKISAGSANNALSDLSVEQVLIDQGIIHVHDPVISSGGLIVVYAELNGHRMDRVKEEIVKKVSRNVAEVVTLAKLLKKSTNEVAKEIAELRLGQRKYEILSLANYFGKSHKEISKILSKKDKLVGNLLSE